MVVMEEETPLVVVHPVVVEAVEEIKGIFKNSYNRLLSYVDRIVVYILQVPLNHLCYTLSLCT